MAAYAKRFGLHLVRGVRRLPFRGRTVPLETILVLKGLMHADHLRILAVADGASCCGLNCIHEDDHGRAYEEKKLHGPIVTPGEKNGHDLDHMMSVGRALCGLALLFVVS